MSGPGTPIYPVWTLQRESQTCGHHVPVPLPIHRETSAYPTEKPENDVEAPFLCPECGLVRLYSRSDLHRRPSGSTGPYQADQLLLVYIQVECVDSSCKSLTKIHIVWDVETKSPKCTTPPTEWVISPDVVCESGHQLKSLQATRLRYYKAGMPF